MIKKCFNSGVIVCFFLFGCARSPLHFYPNFVNQKNNIQKMTITGDFLMMQDVNGSFDLINIPSIKKDAEDIFSCMRTDLENKGYRVSRAELGAIGMFAGKESKIFKVINTPEEEKLNKSELQKTDPPFYINPIYNSSLEKRKALEKICMELSNYSQISKKNNYKIPEATYLKSEEDGFGLFTLLESRKVSFGKSMAQGVFTALATMGMFAVWQTSYTNMSLFIINLDSGEILWSDILGEQSADNKTVNKLVKKIVTRIPER